MGFYEFGMTENTSNKNNNYFDGKKVLVTGGNGFLGSFVIEQLLENGCKQIYAPRSKGYDLRKEEDVKKMFSDIPADVIIHLAAKVGGIGYNLENPGSLFYDNLMMGASLMEQARKHNVQKFVATGTICAYPKFTPVPFQEKDLWSGYPEETNAPYGLAKKMLLVQSQAYRKQYGFNSIFLLPVNLYGPRDNFNPNSSHVIPAIIKKCADAVKNGDKEIVCWGDGSPTREFLYAQDAAKGIVLATQNYNKDGPVNLGSGMEISIKDLTEKIAGYMNFNGKISWDKTKPNGQPRRCLDVSVAEKEFGFKANTNFDDGLKKTIEWYLENYK